MGSLPDDCNTIASSWSTGLKNSTENCHGVDNVTVAVLLEDIVVLIINKLDLVGFHHFSAVCRSWQSIAIAAKKTRLLHLRPQLPWLMVSHLFGFFSLSHDEVFRLELPEIYDTQCCGCNWGWLIMVGEMRRIFLLHPFTRAVIDQLPTQATLPVLDDCLVVAIYGSHHLALCRLGDEAWTTFGNYHFEESFEDIIFYEGKLYAITFQYELILVELHPHPKGTSCNVAPPAEEEFSPLTKRMKSFYLVERLGDLLMVIRCHVFVDSMIIPKPAMFKIFKLDLKGRCWNKGEDLDDQMLFIGTSTGFSLSAVDFPGFRGNCIYFTDDFSHDFSV
ncbi:F-box protein At4g00893-like [Telopea speciosissima]|uniref:F-box protein At4g00893-like n=1 Tax=Telopea speciosissima TaxID=54955 RepID=UPI001CC6349C|nr:F-box protein At4g00893-like [Telopea speciosissima]